MKEKPRNSLDILLQVPPSERMGLGSKTGCEEAEAQLSY